MIARDYLVDHDEFLASIVDTDDGIIVSQLIVHILCICTKNNSKINEAVN